MAKMLKIYATSSLGKYVDMGFKLYEDADHTIVLEHEGTHTARFTLHATKEAIRTACQRHLLRWHPCPHTKHIGYGGLVRTDASVDLCEINDKFCLLESGLEYETYDEYLKEDLGDGSA